MDMHTWKIREGDPMVESMIVGVLHGTSFDEAPLVGKIRTRWRWVIVATRLVRHPSRLHVANRFGSCPPSAIEVAEKEGRRDCHQEFDLGDGQCGWRNDDIDRTNIVPRSVS